MRRGSAVALLAAAAALGACGDDDKNSSAENTPTDSAERALATTPEESWAAKLCTSMAEKAKTVQPPEVNAKTPEATKKALVAFFKDVGDQLSDQVAVVEEVGPPPGESADDAWKKAVVRMKATEDEVGEIRRSLRASSASSSGDIDKTVATLGTQMKTLSEYQGPVAELSENKALATALSSEPACAKVS